MRAFVVDRLELLSPRLMNQARYGWHVGLRGWHGEVGLYRTLARALDGASGAAVDVGGNTGIVSRLLSKLYEQVHVVEPVPVLASRLQRALPHNCQVHPVGLGPQAGKMTMRIPVNENGKELRALSTLSTDNKLAVFGPAGEISYEVDVMTLDQVLEGVESPKFVKIDVEGFENEVLKGSAHVLAVDRPVLYVEICKYHNPRFGDAFGIMRDHGYNTYKWWNNALLPADLTDIENQQVPESSESADCVYDFIFIPSERTSLVGTVNRLG